jgi:Spy/CpxP family protein refolding chaperone
MRRAIVLKGLVFGLCALLMAAAPVAAQSSGSGTEKSTGYPYEKKHEAVSHGKKLVSDFDVKLKDLESQISRDTSAAKADAQRQLRDLKAQRVETGKKLDELGHASAQSWDSMKKGFASSYRDLQQSFDKTVAGFKK